MAHLQLLISLVLILTSFRPDTSLGQDFNETWYNETSANETRPTGEANFTDWSSSIGNWSSYGNWSSGDNYTSSWEPNSSNLSSSYWYYPNETAQCVNKEACKSEIVHIRAGYANWYPTDHPRYQQACLTDNDTVLVCDEQTDAFFRSLQYETLRDIPCYGNVTFKLMSNRYWFNDSTLYKIVDGQKLAVGSARKFEWMSARFKPNEAKGWFYCRTTTSPSSPYYSYDGSIAYFYNGSYYDLATDANGTIIKTPSLFHSFTEIFHAERFDDEESCRQAGVCCWFTAMYNVNRNGTRINIVTDFIYNGTWFFWNNETNSYEFVNGEFNYEMARCVKLLSNLQVSSVNGTKYQFLNGSLFKLTPDSSSFDQVSEFELEADHLLENDPLATGGYFYVQRAYSLSEDGDEPIGAYRNVTGDWWVNVKNGKMQIQRRPPDCREVSDTLFPPAEPSRYPIIEPVFYQNSTANGTDLITNNAQPSCSQTDDNFRRLGSETPCDPTSPVNQCGTGFYCQNVSAIYELPCKMGVCIANLTAFCPALMSNLTRISNETVRQRYGQPCKSGSDCFTGICINGTCACSSCTKILPKIDHDLKTKRTTYKELCIPNNSTVGGLGDACDLWATIKSHDCALGLSCAKCPELWNSKFSPAKCVAIRPELLTQRRQCPSTFKCGYLASCIMIGDVPTCTCPSGYNLESNMIDCYGWKLVAEGGCSVMCGNGFKMQTRSCEKAPGSTSECEGTATIPTFCIGGPQCPLSANAVKAAVFMSIRSQVLTPELFENIVEGELKIKVAKTLNSKCWNDQRTFEAQCCPGKAWSTPLKNSSSTGTSDCVSETAGVNFLSEFTDGTKFSFYIAARGNAEGACCKNARVRARREVAGGDSYSFDQGSLQTIIVEDPALLASMTQSLQKIDPNIEPITADSIKLSANVVAVKPSSANLLLASPSLVILGAFLVQTTVGL